MISLSHTGVRVTGYAVSGFAIAGDPQGVIFQARSAKSIILTGVSGSLNSIQVLSHSPKFTTMLSGDRVSTASAGSSVTLPSM